MLANRIHDYALKNRINFLFDGTFANRKYAVENIKRSIKRSRKIQIFYLFQDPVKAWEFTLARANKDGRVVPLDIFIDDYFLAKDVVSEIKTMFPNEVVVDLIIRDYQSNEKKVYFNIKNMFKLRNIIDSHLALPYNREKLMKLIID